MSDVTEEQRSTALPGAGTQPTWIEKSSKQWKLYAGIALVLTVVVGGIYWYNTQQEEKNTEAATQLSRVRQYFVDGLFEQALSGDSIPPVGGQEVLGLLEISEQYQGSNAGSVAALMAGNALANLGKYSDARIQFDRAASNDALLTQVGAMQGVAVCLEAEGNLAGAAEQYQKAAQKGAETAFEGQCLYMAGLCFEKSGNSTKAGEMYMLVSKKLASSPFSASARSGLARLGMAID